MNNFRTITAAKDTITQFLARRYPLKNIANDVIALRKLNSKERRVLFDLVFRWCREIYLFEAFIKTHIPFASGFSEQEKNGLLIDVFALLVGLTPINKNSAALLTDYEAYVKALGDTRYLLSLNPFMRERLIKDYGDDALVIAKGLSTRAPKYLAFDQNVINVEDVKKALSFASIASFPHPRLSTAIGTYDDLNLSVLPEVIRHNVWFMDAGSQIIALLIAPKADEHVLDMCAGEGNKARYITMRKCHYVAVDIDGARLKKAARRLLHKNINFVVADSRALPAFHESFDWILLDAPCTGTGVLRRHPDLMHRQNVRALNETLQLQRELLDSAITLLKPNGILIYATCSLLRDENELQIDALEKRNSRVKPLKLKDLFAKRIRLDNAADSNKMTIFPHIDDCDGFFFAAVKKMSA